MNRGILLAAVMLYLTGAAAARADVLATDTALGSGDLPGDQNIRTLVGTLAAGSNTVSGTHVFDLFGGGAGQGDTFAVILPAGLLLVSNTLTIPNAVMDATDGTSVAARFYRPLPGEWVDEFAGQVFSGDGTYNFRPPPGFDTAGPQEL